MPPGEWNYKVPLFMPKYLYPQVQTPVPDRKPAHTVRQWFLCAHAPDRVKINGLEFLDNMMQIKNSSSSSSK